MAKIKCAGCGNWRTGPFCNVCGAELASQQHTFRHQILDAFKFRELLEIIASTVIVVVAPVRMAHEWCRGSRDFSSPIKVFLGTVVVTAVIVKFSVSSVVGWLFTWGVDAQSGTIAFQGVRFLYWYFPEGFSASIRDPVGHLIRVRATQNLIGLPWSAVTFSFATWLVFHRKKVLRLSADESRAIVLYVMSGTWLQGLSIATLGYLTNSIAIWAVSGAYMMIAPLVGIVMGISRITAPRSNSVGIYAITWRVVLAFLIAELLYFPVAVICDIVALYPSQIFQVIS